LGYRIKLDTNGYRPEVLARLLEEKLLDYVAMDIKASKVNYARAVGLDMNLLTGADNGGVDKLTQVGNMGAGERFSIESIEKSVEFLKGSSIDYEFRTTVVNGIHTVEEFEEIGKWLAGCNAYYLQVFQENENVLAARLRRSESAGNITFSAFSRTDMEQMADLAGKYVDKVCIRGID